MSTNTLSPFGYILSILNISITDMSKTLYIDRTLISKWKTGARDIPHDSEYINTMADYLLSKAALKKPDLLALLFAKKNMTKEADIKSCLIQFISTKTIPSKKSLSAKSDNFLYKSNFDIYVGNGGKIQSISLLFDMMENLDKNCNLYIVEHNLQQQMLLEQAFRELLLTKLLKTLQKGHTVILVHNTFNYTHNFDNFLCQYNKIKFHKNFHEYTDPLPEHYLLNSCYLLENYICIKSNPFATDQTPLYTAIFKDLFTIEKSLCDIQHIIKIATARFKPVSSGQKHTLLRFMSQDSLLADTTYFTNAIPTIATMTEPLFAKLLTSNHLTEKEQHLAMKFYKMLRNNIVKSTAHHIHFKNDISEHAHDKEIIYYELANFLGKKITATKKDYLQHLKNTATTLAILPDYSISLLDGSSIPSRSSLTYLKKNMWCYQSSNSEISPILFSNEPHIVANIQMEFDHYLASSLLSDKETTTNWLMEFMKL